MLRRLLAAVVVSMTPATAFAQMYPPIEGSLGGGVLIDRSPPQSSSAVVGGLSWDYDEHWRVVTIVEGEIGATSEAAPCRAPSGEDKETCWDAAVLGGFRFRRVPHAASGFRPFAQVLVGTYWKGSGSDDPAEEYASSHFAVQAGVGLELRWPGSFQGIRLSADVRHVVAGDRDRNQLRLSCAYVIGPRRFARRP